MGKETGMRFLLAAAIVPLLLVRGALGADLVNVAGASGVALDGYDPVAFFTDGEPVHGSPGITATHRGATWFFASEDHRQRFVAEPDRYVPQYGGYCAFGVALGALFPVDVSTWQIRNGKLYLNLNPEILKSFNEDLEGNLAKADAAWPELVEKHGR
jgi:YHS domain-containing protein